MLSVGNGGNGGKPSISYGHFSNKFGYKLVSLNWCAEVKVTVTQLRWATESGKETELNLTSALEDGGDGGRAPNMCCESSISLALSDLWTPARKPSGRLGGWMSTGVKDK